MRLEALRANISAAQSTIEKENALISKLEAERVDSERATNLKRLSSLKEKERDLNVKLKHYEDRDPTVLKKLGEKIEEAMEHATRWGSNLATIRCVPGRAEIVFGLPAAMLVLAFAPRRLRERECPVLRRFLFPKGR